MIFVQCTEQSLENKNQNKTKGKTPAVLGPLWNTVSAEASEAWGTHLNGGAHRASGKLRQSPRPQWPEALFG